MIGAYFHHYSVAYGVMSVRFHTLSKSGFASHSPYRKQGLPGRGKLAFGRPKLAYGLMTVRLHTLPKSGSDQQQGS